MRHDPKTGGFEVIGMGAVLSHPAFRQGVPKDFQFHLRALYTDPRGVNLRNHLAHGMAHGFGKLGGPLDSADGNAQSEGANWTG
jgi:hypothetical protein